VVVEEEHIWHGVIVEKLLNLVLDVKKTKLGPVCLLENSFLLKSEFRDSEFQESELFSDVW
jgi:hypothetical protein